VCVPAGKGVQEPGNMCGPAGPERFPARAESRESGTMGVPAGMLELPAGPNDRKPGKGAHLPRDGFVPRGDGESGTGCAPSTQRVEGEGGETAAGIPALGGLDPGVLGTQKIGQSAATGGGQLLQIEAGQLASGAGVAVLEGLQEVNGHADALRDLLDGPPGTAAKVFQLQTRGGQRVRPVDGRRARYQTAAAQ